MAPTVLASRTSRTLKDRALPLPAAVSPILPAEDGKQHSNRKQRGTIEGFSAPPWDNVRIGRESGEEVDIDLRI